MDCEVSTPSCLWPASAIQQFNFIIKWPHDYDITLSLPESSNQISAQENPVDTGG
jgi:hypothetical protein